MTGFVVDDENPLLWFKELTVTRKPDDLSEEETPAVRLRLERLRDQHDFSDGLPVRPRLRDSVSSMP